MINSSGNGLSPVRRDSIVTYLQWQATGIDAWASRVKCPARFVSHLHEICIYIWVVYSLCLFCCLFITVTWWYVWCIEWASGNHRKYRHVWQPYGYLSYHATVLQNHSRFVMLMIWKKSTFSWILNGFSYLMCLFRLIFLWEIWLK